MKGITQLETRDFLVQLNRIRGIAAEFLTQTNVLEIRKHAPVFTGNETDAEITAKRKAQIAKNISDMLDEMLEKHPDETARLLESMIVYEEGEEHLKGAKLVSRGMVELMNEDVLNFFISFAMSGLLMPGN